MSCRVAMGAIESHKETPSNSKASISSVWLRHLHYAVVDQHCGLSAAYCLGPIHRRRRREAGARF